MKRSKLMMVAGMMVLMVALGGCSSIGSMFQSKPQFDDPRLEAMANRGAYWDFQDMAVQVDAGRIMVDLGRMGRNHDMTSTRNKLEAKRMRLGADILDGTRKPNDYEFMQVPEQILDGQ